VSGIGKSGGIECQEAKKPELGGRWKRKGGNVVSFLAGHQMVNGNDPGVRNEMKIRWERKVF